MLQRTRYTTEETADLVGATLRDAFPGVAFEVTALPAKIVEIAWRKPGGSGPSIGAVDIAVDQFRGADIVAGQVEHRDSRYVSNDDGSIEEISHDVELIALSIIP